MIRISDLSRVQRPNATLRLFVEADIKGVGLILFNTVEWPIAAMCFGTGTQAYDVAMFKAWMSKYGFNMDNDIGEELVTRFLEVREDWVKAKAPEQSTPDWLGTRAERTFPDPTTFVEDEVLPQVALAC
jgi:hypothetical protein